MDTNKLDFPTEEVELPSQGVLYPEDNPLSSGKVEIKYMTAKEEDILTNQNYIEKGTVLDKLLESLIVSDINYKDLFIGDKNALLIAARILGYGKDYEFEYKGEKVTADLTQIENKPLKSEMFKQGQNEFSYTLPVTSTPITFKFLTHKDEAKIDQELKGLKKINKNSSPDFSTRLKHMILSVNGENDQNTIRKFVDTNFLAQDSRAFRKHLKDIQPDVDMTVSIETSDGGQEDVELPIGINFFWPDAEV